jgi:hypothetical protein
VARWEWYSWDAFDLRPLQYERNLDKPGRRLEERPGPEGDHHRIGFDTNGRPVVFEEYSGSPYGRLDYETFRDHKNGRVEQARYPAVGDPIYLHEYAFEEGRIASAWMAARGGASHEKYHYTGDLVTRIVVHHGQAPGRPGERVLPIRLLETIHAFYDDTGLTRLEISWHGGPVGSNRTVLRYERPPDSFTIGTACETVRRELLARIPETVAELGIEKPAYCVALAYLMDEPAEFLVYVGLDEVREEFPGRKHENDCPWVGWNPGDIGEDVAPDMSAVEDTVRLLAQELKLANAEDLQAERGNERSRELICGVAKDLNAFNWSAVLPTTDDFVVYATDLEQIDLDRNMAACLPPARLADFRERGLL